MAGRFSALSRCFFPGHALALCLLMALAQPGFAQGASNGFAGDGSDFRMLSWGMGLEEVKRSETARLLAEEIMVDEPEVLLLNYGNAELWGRRGGLSYFFVEKQLFSANFILPGAGREGFEDLRARLAAFMGEDAAFSPKPDNRGDSCSWAKGRLRVRLELHQTGGRDMVIIWVFPSEAVVAEKFADYQDVIAVQRSRNAQ